MDNPTVSPARPTQLETMAREYGLAKEISNILGNVSASADGFESLSESTALILDTSPNASAHELRMAAFRLRGTSLQLARLLEEISTAAGRLESLAWALQAFDLETEDEGSDEEGGAS